MKARILLLSFSFLVSELLLQILNWGIPDVARLLSGPWDRDQEIVADARFRFRGNPLYPGNDEAGYRNPKRLERADIVTLGDSQTYGLFVARDQAWPHVLDDEIEYSVYNMAVDGYGPGQYLLQLDEALSLNPRWLLLAVYFGNDFFDAFAFLNHLPAAVYWVDSDSRNEAERLERERPIEEEFKRAFALHGKDNRPTKQTSSIRLWVSQNVRLYGLLRAFKDRVFSPVRMPAVLSKQLETSDHSLSSIQKLYLSVFNGSLWRTILTGGYRSLVVNDRDPRIKVGFEVTQSLLSTMAERCRAVGTRLVVVLLPTKESVFWPHVKDPNNHAGLSEVVMNEERLKHKLMSSLRRHDIKYLDVLEALRNAAEQPYFEDADGHPNAVGHQVIGRTIAAYLEKTQSQNLQSHAFIPMP